MYSKGRQKLRDAKKGCHANMKNYHCYITDTWSNTFGIKNCYFKVPYHNGYKKFICTLTAFDHNIGEQFVTKSKRIVCKPIYQ